MKTTSKSIIYLCCGVVAVTVLMFFYFMFMNRDADEIVYFEFGEKGEGTDIAVPGNYLIPGTPVDPEHGSMVWAAATLPDFTAAECSGGLTCVAPNIVKIVISRDINVVQRQLRFDSMNGRFSLETFSSNLNKLKFSKYSKIVFRDGRFLSKYRKNLPTVYFECNKQRCNASTEFDDDLSLSYYFDLKLMPEWSMIDLGVRQKVAEFVRMAEEMR